MSFASGSGLDTLECPTSCRALVYRAEPPEPDPRRRCDGSARWCRGHHRDRRVVLVGVPSTRRSTADPAPTPISTRIPPEASHHVLATMPSRRRPRRRRPGTGEVRTSSLPTLRPLPSPSPVSSARRLVRRRQMGAFESWVRRGRSERFARGLWVTNGWAAAPADDSLLRVRGLTATRALGWSPSGAQLVVGAYLRGARSFSSMPRPAIDHLGRLSGPSVLAWSPDGTQIAYGTFLGTLFSSPSPQVVYSVGLLAATNPCSPARSASCYGGQTGRGSVVA